MDDSTYTNIDLANFFLFMFEVAFLFISSFVNFYSERLENKVFWISKLNILLFFTELILPIFKFDLVIIVILSLRSINILLLFYIFYLHIKQDVEEQERNNRRDGLYGLYHVLCLT